ncbi:hypothetical protein [Woeseia oceani]|nr:hypothetical protein [Woeseia oceani]
MGLLAEADPAGFNQNLTQGLLGAMFAAPNAKFTTNIGKLFSDLETAEQQGNAEAATALRAEIQRNAGTAVDFDDLRNTRNDVIKNSADFVEARAGFDRVETGFSAGTAPGDLAGTFGFMKLLDPGSTVREGEQATVRNARGIPEQIRGIYNRLLNGESLTPNQRLEFRSQALAQLRDASTRQNKLIEDARGFAQRNGLPVSDVVPQYLIPGTLPELAATPAGQAHGQPLTEAERAELQQLRKEFGIGH